MDDALFRTMLFDFYGELLTEKQKQYFDWHYNDDLSLAEIGESEGISRQGAWDMIRRAEENMRRYEEKTGLVARFSKEKETVAAALALNERLLSRTDGESRQLAQELFGLLQELSHGI